MSRASGIVLIAAGLALAVYALPSGELTEADFGRGADVAKARPADNSTRVVIVPPEPKPVIRPQQAAAEPVPPFSAPVVVTIAQRPSELARAVPMPRDRDAIGRELQKELRRVGCYDGELNGAWTTSTKQAMKVFIDRVNASTAHRRARQHPPDHGAWVSGPGVRQGLPGGARPRRRWPLRAERYPGARRA